MSYANPEYIKKIGFKPSEIISFAGGWVNHKSPEELQQAYKDIINNESLFHKSGNYSPTLGINECKKALIDFENHLYKMDNIDIDQIAIGANSTQLTYDLLKVILEPRDKILLLDPSYCNYPTQINMSFPEVEILRFSVFNPDSWEYTANEKIEELSRFIWDKKPKVILLVAPDNPTSKIVSDDFFTTALECARKIGSFVVVDFAYKEITFNKKVPKYFSLEPNENFISIHSNSKWGKGLGRRLGWVEAPNFIIESMESFLNSSILCPDTLHQMALTRYIEDSINKNKLKPYLNEMNEKYELAARQTLLSIKNHLNFPAIKPDGGIYTCMKIDKNGAEFVRDILNKTGVLFVPGWGFGKTMDKAVRISYGPLVNDLDKIDEGMKRVGEYIKNVKN
mgnify:CR=1 FL=1